MTNGRPTRDMVFLLVGAAGLYIAFWLAVRLRGLLVMLLISLFLAFALEPAANALARRAGAEGWPPGPCSLVSSYLHRYEVVAGPLVGPSG